jgi:DNA-binding NarL/FixJ family response regulator
MRPRVLLADDYPGMVTAVSRLLSLDCEVVGTVADASALMESVQRLQPDLVVLDLNLPDLSGLEACRQITQAYPQTKVIVYTAVTDPEVRQRSLAVGASAFVSKLGPVTDLLSAIKRLSVEP